MRIIFTFIFCMIIGLSLRSQNVFPSSGNVGIGTSTPRSQLEVMNAVRISPSAAGSSILLQGDQLSTENNWSNVKLVAGSGSGSGWFKTSLDNFGGYFSWAVNSANGERELMRLNADNGNLGIGISNPQYILDVANNSRVSGSLLLEQPGTRGFLRIKPPSGTKTTRVIDFFEDADPAASAYGVIGITNESWGAPVPSFSIISSKNGIGGPTKDIMVWANDAPDATNAAMTIKANSGNIGIGTSNPQAKLAVNGDIFSKKVKVTQTGCPDYVLEKDYKIPTLEEVEAFIKKNKHLPDVPSATTIEKEGLDLGDNHAVLLKKIEELTLYLIEQNKRIEAQERKINQLEAQLKK